MSRRYLVVPMHETTTATATECGACPMLVEDDFRGEYCTALQGDDGVMKSTGFDREHGRSRFERLPACIAAEEAAQE